MVKLSSGKHAWISWNAVYPPVFHAESQSLLNVKIWKGSEFDSRIGQIKFGAMQCYVLKALSIICCSGLCSKLIIYFFGRQRIEKRYHCGVSYHRHDKFLLLGANVSAPLSSSRQCHWHHLIFSSLSLTPLSLTLTYHQHRWGCMSSISSIIDTVEFWLSSVTPLSLAL